MAAATTALGPEAERTSTNPAGMDTKNATSWRRPRRRGFGRSCPGDVVPPAITRAYGRRLRRGSRIDSLAMVEKIPNKLYEQELARLQEELVKMEEWIFDKKARVAVVFEGRDAAGKGGVIKRITEHLNPRTRSTPARLYQDRSNRTVLVQSGRRRARPGVLHARGVPPVPPTVPDLRATPRRGRHHPDQVLVLRFRSGAGAPLPQAGQRPDATVEALRHGPLRALAVGRLLTREGRDVRPYRHPRGAVVRRRGGQQETCPPQLHRASALTDPVG